MNCHGCKMDFEEIMEKICDLCHMPYICKGQDELEKCCAECEAEKAIKRALGEG